MSQPALQDDLQVRDRIASLLGRRRNYQQEVKDLTAQNQYVVFYGCGAILGSILDTWREYVGRTIDYCCDSNPEKWGKDFYGVRCLSPKELLAIKGKCVVFVTIGQFKPVWDWLTANGFPSVNLLYKYDLVASAYLAEHDHREIARNLYRARQLLADERSHEVFDAIVARALGESQDPALMVDICEPNQYFPADIVKLSDHERFVDIGAYNGDTVKDLVERTNGRFERIFAFEVDRINFRALQENVPHMPGADRIRVFNLGIWDSECDITYSIGKSQSTIGDGDGKGHVVPLDDTLGKEEVTFIKMDIEGAEPRALQGARKIIQAHKPRLAVCVYHHLKHLWEVPLYIHELVPAYRLFLRHHTTLDYETVCYAVI